MTSTFLNISVDGTLGGESPSDTRIASEKAVKTYADTKQAALVSGTNIKTINNTSILGSGNITIGGSEDEAYTASEVQTIWDGVS